MNTLQKTINIIHTYGLSRFTVVQYILLGALCRNRRLRSCRRDSVWRVGGFVVATLYLVAVVSKVWLFLIKRYHLESSFVQLHSNLAGGLDCRPRRADVTHREDSKMGADGTVVHGHGWHLNDDNHISVAGCTIATPI